jgi:hypothetical protein
MLCDFKGVLSALFPILLLVGLATSSFVLLSVASERRVVKREALKEDAIVVKWGVCILKVVGVVLKISGG